jgi:tight adherence protein C
MQQLPLPLPVLGLIAFAFVAGSYALLRAIERDEKVRARLARVTGPDAGPVIEPKGDGGKALDLIAKLGAALAKSGMLSDTTRAQLEQTINQAGLRGSRVFGLFIGSKVLLMTGLPAAMYLLIGNKDFSPTTFWALEGGAFAAGMLAPDFFIKQMRKRHLKQVEAGLPDALDMMVICAQAGLGLENAIDRVAQEFVYANKAVAMELAICASEMRIGTDRRTALIALGERTGLETMRRLAGTLIQTMQFGTPLSQALRVLASEMRSDNLTKFEERAARLPVFLTLPMICFILPCVFIIVGGPAGLQMGRTLGPGGLH